MVPSHGNDQGGRRPLDIHDPLVCGWLVAHELKVDDPITLQPVQERVHVLFRRSNTCGCLSAHVLRLTDARSRQGTRRRRPLGRLPVHPAGMCGRVSALQVLVAGARGRQGARRRPGRRPLRLIEAPPQALVALLFFATLARDERDQAMEDRAEQVASPVDA
jgi:hypothetical protein